MSQKIVAVIPARKNSKRLPGKNHKLFGGLPLVHYSIRFAQLQPAISKIVVSTDDDVIKKIASDMGVTAIDRPEEIAGDFATTASAIQHILLELEKQDEHFDLVTTLQVTNPLRSKMLFSDTLDLLLKKPEATSAITVTRNRQKLGLLTDDYFVPQNYTAGQRSQDMTPQYYENGLLYISKADMVKDRQDLFGDRVLGCETEESLPYIDIDELSDFEYGEFLLDRNPGLFSYLI